MYIKKNKISKDEKKAAQTPLYKTNPFPLGEETSEKAEELALVACKKMGGRKSPLRAVLIKKLCKSVPFDLINGTLSVI